MKIFTKGWQNGMVQTMQKNIRVTPEHWKRVEKEAEKRDISPNRLVVELTMEALERREWPRTEAEIHLLRSAMFAAQAIIRDMERAGREEEIRGNQQGYLRSRAAIAKQIGEGLAGSGGYGARGWVS